MPSVGTTTVLPRRKHVVDQRTAREAVVEERPLVHLRSPLGDDSDGVRLAAHVGRLAAEALALHVVAEDVELLRVGTRA